MPYGFEENDELDDEYETLIAEEFWCEDCQDFCSDLCTHPDDYAPNEQEDEYLVSVSPF